MSLPVSSCKALWLQHTCSPSPAQSCWADGGVTSISLVSELPQQY